ncbi:SusC/RagA family TonB-linked outer membrane protein [Algoriphagus sp. NBT04N3]|jgi:TonB-dependent starch-binding outer membrane protein SusC|uniref:SusC/RagA family TonB-linked outer membrane protein n=1 Tax=Algoriphagus sp. NBT04N3 TaxID=2705473 RepID=UPI001C62E534|nr:SusC/RagA family TonB-linked outer membrane protein [Algoriphagus sp. NBT04N3]QYH40548.1 SusC/RagA family TonB-linked outer membrane protein [Algoriphagus sp. NBT04N3]
MKKILLLILGFLLISLAHSQENEQYLIKGVVYDQASGETLPGVNILIKGTTLGTVSNDEGVFSLQSPGGNQTLLVSFIGYRHQELNLTLPISNDLEIYLKEDELLLASFEVLSTGFQELTPERSTGSFAYLDNELINRRVSTNLIDRMEDLTPGLVFNRDRPDLEKGESISIRGNSSLFTDNNPLIVVDNLAYDGPLSSINPNDVESITVLRDAAAASIWGAKAGNGVIVITTKSGKFASPIKVNLVSNLTVGQAFDPFYAPQMGIGEFVEVERRLFDQGFYDGDFNSFDQRDLSPVVETLFQFRNGELSENELENRLNAFKSRDLRTYLQEDFYRSSLNQQYALNVSGGSPNYTYFAGIGYDRNRESQVSASSHRITINLRQNWRSSNERWKVGLTTYLANSQNQSGFPFLEGLAPYDRLKDESGNPLPVFRNYTVRFIKSLRDTELLNWDYFPLREINESRTFQSSNEIRINPSLSYEFLEGLSFRADYQYWRSLGKREQLNPLSSYFSRNLINLYSTLLPSGEVSRVIPLGGINDFDYLEAFSHTLRTQLNYSKVWREKHELTALAGFELKDFQRRISAERAYGVDEITGIPQPVDYLNFYTQIHTGFPDRIPFRQNYGGFTDRFLSGFANLGYTFNKRYLLTVSARRDASNLYGVKTNNRAVPLWSAGLGWILSEENWIQNDWISFLKLKLSYGFNGNTNPAATAFTTAQYFTSASNSLVGRPWLSILSPPNPQLRWERIKIVNFGTEFELARQRLTGSIEGYQKQGIDLFGVLPTYPSSGQSNLTKNYARTNTIGLDILLNGRIMEGPVEWNASLMYSHFNEKVVDYRQNPTASQVAGYSSGLFGISPVPVEGYPLYSIFSFPFAGLDPDTGDPLGLLNGEPSSDYASILNQTELEDLIFEGSSIPTHFGALRNSFFWKGFELSANISFRLGYYFKKESVEYDQLNRGEITHSDYALRWQNPGDEQMTDIPSDPEMNNPRRATFDRISSRRVRKGDHIRWQDLRVSYTWDKSKFSRLPVQRVQLYTYLDNLGILWKAAKDVKDPDYRNFQAPRTFSMGLSVNF